MGFRPILNAVPVGDQIAGRPKGGFVTKFLLTMDDTWGTVWVRRSNQASAEALDLGLFGHVAIVEFGQL
jgi:hypothetical protein